MHGTSASALQEWKCLSCPKGTVTASAEAGAAKCLPCPRGFYGPDEKATECVACSSGELCPVEGS